MPTNSAAHSLLRVRALLGALAIEAGMIGFLLLSFPVFHGGFSRLLVALPLGFLAGWVLQAGVLLALGRRARFPWLLILLLAPLRAPLPWLGVMWAWGAGVDEIVESVWFLGGVYCWGGLLWSVPGAIAYGSLWERSSHAREARA